MSDLKNMIYDGAHRLFNDFLSWENLKLYEEQVWPEELWTEFSKLGFTNIFSPDDQSGINAKWTDAQIILKASGYHGAPLPVGESLASNWFASRNGMVLPDGHWAITNGPIKIDEKLNKVDFENLDVAWGRYAKQLLHVDERRITLIELGDKLSIEKLTNLANEPRDKISGKGKVIESVETNLTKNPLHWIGSLVRSCQIAGAAGQTLDLSLKYSKDREQFGRPISKFQTIQNYLADLAGLSASLDAISIAAANDLDLYGLSENSQARITLAAAKCRSSEGVEKVTRLSHQVHGAIGFTYEYGLHFYTKRLWSWRDEYGSAVEWGSFLGDIALKHNSSNIWPLVTNEEI